MEWFKKLLAEMRPNHSFWRKRVGVEPTQGHQMVHTGFEVRPPHRERFPSVLFAAKLYAIRTLARGACTCRFRGSGSVVHQYSGCDGGKHHTASRQHWCSPCIMLLIVMLLIVGLSTVRSRPSAPAFSLRPGIASPRSAPDTIGRNEAREGRSSSGRAALSVR